MPNLDTILKHGFFWLVVRPVVLLVLNLDIRNRERLPQSGPVVVVANHNSHLDSVVLMSLLPQRLLARTRPVAAADYFLAKPLLAWFSRRVMGAVALDRRPPTSTHQEDPLAAVQAALDNGDVLILFPEGTRGEPERMGSFKNGIAHVAQRNPQVPVIPVFLYGMGKAMPKGALLPLPAACGVIVGEALRGGEGAWAGHRRRFMEELELRIRMLAAEDRQRPAPASSRPDREGVS